MSDLYRDFIDQKADQIINSLGGTITPAPGNAELYRDFLDRKFDDVINALTIKEYEYRGNGNTTVEITLPQIPKLVLFIFGKTPNTSIQSGSFNSYCNFGCSYLLGSNSNTPGSFTVSIVDNKITITANTATKAFNVSGLYYKVYYI